MKQKCSVIYYKITFPIILGFCRGIGSALALRYFSQISYHHNLGTLIKIGSVSAAS